MFNNTKIFIYGALFILLISMVGMLSSNWQKRSVLKFARKILDRQRGLRITEFQKLDKNREKNNKKIIDLDEKIMENEHKLDRVVYKEMSDEEIRDLFK